MLCNEVSLFYSDLAQMSQEALVLPRYPSNLTFRSKELRASQALQYVEYMDNLYKELYPSNPKFDIKDIITWHDKHYGK